MTGPSHAAPVGPAKPDRAQQAGQIGAQAPHGGLRLGPGIDRDH